MSATATPTACPGHGPIWTPTVGQRVTHNISGRTGQVRATKTGQAFVEWTEQHFGRPAESWMTTDLLTGI